MENMLAVIEPTAHADEAQMDPKKLKFFNSKLNAWDFAKISSFEFQSLSFDDKLNLSKKYYVEMLARYTEGKGKMIFCCFLAIFWLCFWLKFG